MLTCSIDLSQLSDFEGSMLVNSTTSFNCSTFNDAVTQGRLGPHFRCIAPDSKINSSSSSSSFPSSYPSSSSSLSSVAKGGIGAGSAIGFLLLYGIIWYVIQVLGIENKRELEAQEEPFIPELSAEKADAELEAGHGQSEMLGLGQASGYVDAFEMPGSTPER
jgi:hypothetical protein